jgi:hypothetical protein
MQTAVFLSVTLKISHDSLTHFFSNPFIHFLYSLCICVVCRYFTVYLGSAFLPCACVALLLTRISLFNALL